MYICDCCFKEIVNEYDAYFLDLDKIVVCEECYNIEMEIDEELEELAECLENMEID